MASNLPKKAKTTATEASRNEFEQVRNYLLECPFVKSGHPAIQAALKGLDQELKRRERDAKLHSKFMQDAVTVEKPAAAAGTKKQDTPKAPLGDSTEDKRADIPRVDEVMTDDWQDVTEENVPTVPTELSDETCSFLGQRLAKAAIATIAERNLRCQTPLEAIALALHAALCSEVLCFACTGVPESSSPNDAGFAAPIRELPRSQFLPRGWNQNKDSIALRYRKNGSGSVILIVRIQAAMEEDAVEILFNRANSSEPHSDSLVFPLKEHINLDSWKRAQREQSSVSPSLHYKALAGLFTKVAKSFDLGHVAEEDNIEPSTYQQEFPYVDTTVLNLPTRQNMAAMTQGVTGSDMPSSGLPMRPLVHRAPDDRDRSVPTTLDDAFPGLQARNHPGDFAGDLAPGGLSGPGFGGTSPGQTGNLMGANHPAFFGGMAPPQPGLGMRPRFDPIGPPGGPMDPPNNDNNKTQVPPGKARNIPGEPNPDHLRPPNNFSNNMFM